ncbi:DNA recombination protein rmuC [Canicola haemoglobinophilus]|uniref:DNA recombination protein rmuC n=1 Tax=Canicola haemoglobinophilus TaxID=733 RepID=A0AB38HCU2_9PAST|nr:DNA recombination protein rmuC [Canicola haemoglobinophilus]
MLSVENPVFITALLFLIICIILLFMLARKKRDVQELQQDLNKNINDFNQLLAKYESLAEAKNQLEQQVVKAQTLVESSQIRLAERDEKIQYLQKELDEEQMRAEQIAQQITGLKERFGVASAQAESLQQQLNQSRTEKEGRERAWLDLNQKHTALQQELTELKVTLSEKERNFVEQQQNFVQSKQQLSVEFQNLANQILEEKSQRFNQTNQQTLDSLLKPFREQIEGFQKRVNEIHSESLKGNANLESEIKKVLDIGLAMSKRCQ